MCAQNTHMYVCKCVRVPVCIHPSSSFFFSEKKELFGLVALPFFLFIGLRVFMCTCMHCICVCTCVHICMYVSVHVYLYACMCLYMCTCMHVCVCTCVCVRVCVRAYVRVCVGVRACVCVCVAGSTCYVPSLPRPVACRRHTFSTFRYTTYCVATVLQHVYCSSLKIMRNRSSK